MMRCMQTELEESRHPVEEGQSWASWDHSPGGLCREDRVAAVPLRQRQRLRPPETQGCVCCSVITRECGGHQAQEKPGQRQ